MIHLLARLFIRDYKNHSAPKVRSAYGVLCGVMGILFNLLLFGGKYFVGVMTGSVAVIADSFNNLSDCASSVLMLAGFRLASKQADEDHPYGHGRMEYVTGMVISFLIMLMGFELLKTSADKIFHPQPVTFSLTSAVILLVSVGIKGYMALYNHKVGKRIDSSAMLATSKDSISDAVATSLVFVCTLISHHTGLYLDGYCGVLVALFILYTGFSSVKDTLDELLGKSPRPELVENIKETVLSHKEVVGIHDLLIHDYGPDRLMVSLHAEVPGDGDIYHLHDVIDHIEMELMEKFRCETTIHMDPIVVNDKTVDDAKRRLISELKNMNEDFAIHDFRMVAGPTHTNFIFDLELPVEYKTTDAQLRREVESMVAEKFENTFAVFKIDRIRF
jgi:cation diffusion facilitator family transporter